jgi:DNA-binding NarL/FixJ family response regulator
MLSSSADEKQIAKAFELGVNSYVEKPSDFSELVHAVSAINQYWFGCNHFPHSEDGIVRPNKKHRAALKV